MEEVIYQLNEIRKKDFDILIILDACRYDIFKSVYKLILGDVGILKKAISPATHTIEWLNKTFGGIYWDDVIYVSANTFVNSKRITPRYKGYTFDGMKHFRRVVDVWDWGWDENLKTVHPEEVTKGAIVTIDMNPRMRFIIHYVQPHLPYIYYGGVRKTASIIMGEKRGNKIKTWKKIIGKTANKFLSQETIWKIALKLGINPDWGMGELWAKYGRDGIIRGYTEDLKLALKYVKVLIDRYPHKKFILTSDHGERLGEKGNYEHGGKRDKEVIEVPWLEINKRKI